MSVYLGHTATKCPHLFEVILGSSNYELPSEA